MVAPVTGPFSETVSQQSGPVGSAGSQVHHVREATWYRQKPPYTIPLYYHSRGVHLDQVRSESGNRNASYTSTLAYYACWDANWDDPHIAGMYNKAYSRFVSKVKTDTAELGAAFAEYRKTADMVNTRALQFYSFVRAVRRGRFLEANALLNVPQGFKPKAKNFGGAVLEYSFGWAPTVSDIYNGMRVLTGGVPPAFVQARAASALVPYVHSRGGSYPNEIMKEFISGRTAVVVGAQISLTNPNLWLANQLGLINPVSVLWELVPFSFLVDYVANVGDVINGWSDFIGIGGASTYRTFLVERVTRDRTQYGINPPEADYPGLAYMELVASGYRMVRQNGALPGPTLRFSPPNVSLRRAATSISLLLQLLKG